MHNILMEFMTYGIKFIAMCLCAFMGIMAGKFLYKRKKEKEKNSN